MDESAKGESHLSSAAAFVEGGVQEACEDTCSICLEQFGDSDPCTVTNCKHEYHLHCILEWCQRSSQCPMCWQTVSFKDPTSQELFEAVEKERNIRLAPPAPRTAIFHHPVLGDFEFHLPVGANGAELEERIFNHLASAAAMGRVHHISRREVHRGRSAARSRQLLLSTANPETSYVGSLSRSSPDGGSDEHVSVVASEDHTTTGSVVSSSRRSTPASEDGAGPSDFQSFSESLKSRWNAVSSRYKESITKSTRGWKERLFSRNSSMATLGPEVRREVNTGMATISRMMEQLDTGESTETHSFSSSTSHGTSGHLASETSRTGAEGLHGSVPSNDSRSSTFCATSSDGI